MPLTKPNQELKRDLKDAAALLKWSGVDLFTISKRLLDAGDEIGAAELMKIALSYQAIEDKFQSMWDIGVRAFSVQLDDISYTTWNCPEDATMFGASSPAAAATAQSYLLNRVQSDFIETHPGAEVLTMAPTEYYDTVNSPYKVALR